MPATYEPIATTTLGSAASTITFSSIGSGYTDLILILTGTASANARLEMRLNGDTGTNYSRTELRGDGATVLSTRNTSQSSIYVSSNNPLGSTISTFTINFFNYAGSTNKTILATGSYDKNGSGGVDRCVGLWRSTAAITSIALSPEFSTATFSIGTTATLYGILKA